MKAPRELALIVLLLPGCAAYKELEPDPLLSPAELGYNELKDGDDNFELEKDNKYFVKFPNLQKENFYLVLVTSAKPTLLAYLTSRFEPGEAAVTPIPDQTVSSDSIYLYPLDPLAPVHYWVIDEVKQDLVLRMKYRNVPQWRYTFETRYSEYRGVLEENRVDRSTYQEINANFNLDVIEFDKEIALIKERTTRISAMEGELREVERVFPPDIAASRDTAYEQYLALRTHVNDELSFQETYATVLNLFKKERDTRSNTAAFVESLPFFAETMSRRDRFTDGVNAKASSAFIARLNELHPFYDNLLRNKNDIALIIPDPSLDATTTLYRMGGQTVPRETESVIRFVNRYNVEVRGLEEGTKKFTALLAHANANISSSDESFFTDLLSRTSEVRRVLPEPQSSRFERYGRYTCATRLERELIRAFNKVTDLQKIYEFSGSIARQIGARMWGTSEQNLSTLHTTEIVSGTPEIAAQRAALVEHFEEEIFSAVKTTSHQRIDAFIKAHEMAIDNVTGLYADSAFQPVYELTFSARGPGNLSEKRSQIQNYLDQIRYIQFPESSIKSIYSQFIDNIGNRGVEKARAIAEHGRFYKGTDKQVLSLIAECDVHSAKSIIRPKEYRKLFALPVTSNKQGTNEYMFRLRLQIPSEAQFPVFDVNLKLPQEVAEKAGQQQWYESITIDKNPIKNEGRFRITSPTAENNYETLITPVQMDKAGRNILEVRFRYPGFKVLEVSAMAQVPIIRKN
jgi:hypothetical protein